MGTKELPRSPDLAELLRIAIMDCIGNIHVSLPGKIESYDATEQKADIKLMVQRPLVARDGTVLDPESIPVLMDVPIAFPRGGAGTGNFMITWPLAKGDLVHVVFNERSIDQYMASDGVETDPIDFRMHNLSDGVAYPGFYPRNSSLVDAHPDNAVFGRDQGMQLHITPDDIAEFRIGGVASEVTIKGNAHKITYDLHLHSSPMGLTGGPTVPMPASDLSTVLKMNDA